MTYWGTVSRSPGWSHILCRVEAGLELLQWCVHSHTWFRAHSSDQISTAVLCWQCPWWCLLTGSILLRWHLPHGLCEVTVFPVEVGEYFREIFFWGGQMYWFLAFASVRAHMLMHGPVSRQRSEECFGFLGAGNAGMHWLAVLVLRSELWPSLFSKYSSGWANAPGLNTVFFIQLLPVV